MDKQDSTPIEISGGQGKVPVQGSEVFPAPAKSPRPLDLRAMALEPRERSAFHDMGVGFVGRGCDLSRVSE